MKKRFYTAVFVLVSFIGGFTGCTAPIDLGNDGMDPLLAIYCVLVDTVVNVNNIEDFSFFVQHENQVGVYKSSSFFGKEEYPEGLAGAKVWINSERLTMKGRGTYVPSDGFCAVPGQTYTLRVEYDMNKDGVDEVYTATTTMPRKYQLDSLSLAPIVFDADFRALFILNYQDSLGEDYIGAKLYNYNDTQWSKLYSNRILRYCLFRFNTSSGDGNYVRVPASDLMIQHEMPYDSDNKYYIYAGDTLGMELNVLSKDYYDFLTAAKTELSQNNPLFTGPRSNVPTNITGGAIGIFGAYTHSTAKMVLPLYTPGLPVRPR